MTPESIWPGRPIVCVDVCESTNDLAWRAASDGAPHGTAFFAEEQTKGRGRRGRRWEAPRGSGLLCSILLRAEIDADRAPLVTVLGALAVAETADRFGVPTRIRFPNDVIAGGRKLAGVLVESRFASSRPDLFILGIGLNVNGKPTGFPATSLSEETGKEVSRSAVARALLEAVEEWMTCLDGPVDRFQEAWTRRSELIGRPVRIWENGKETSGEVVGLHCLDGIELRLRTGHLRAFRSEHVEKLDIL